jgi:hypothetical protein
LRLPEKSIRQKKQTKYSRVYIPLSEFDGFNPKFRPMLTDYISGDKILWSYNAKETVSEDYDDKGILVSTEKTTTTHNSFGHMVRKESITTLANGEKKVDTEERTYDMDGARVLKTVVTEDGKKQTTTYSY